MEELNEIIRDYLRAKETDYAIMIDGDWGSGKSYYIKHDFQELVSSINYEASVTTGEKIRAEVTKGITWIKQKLPQKKETPQQKYDTKKFYPFYVSLYGVSSVEDFNVKVADGVHDWLGKGLQIVTAYAKDKHSVDLPFSAGAHVPYNAVLIFDDLERICTDKISPIEVLGLINAFAEHQNKKVIIVCNEAELMGSTSNRQDGTKFIKYKEKTIRFTYKYVPDIPKVYDSFLGRYKDTNYGNYLIKEKEFILSLFAKGGRKNLRTLKFFIEIYGKLYNIVSAISSEDYREQVLKTLAVTTLIYVMEYKRGETPERLEQLHPQFTLDTASWLQSSFLSESEETTKEENKDEYDITKVQARYSTYYEEMVHLSWLICYVSTGALNNNDVENFVKTQEKELAHEEQSDARKALQKLKGFATISDAAVSPTAKEIWGYIENDQYTMYELLDVYATFAKYSINKIQGVSLPKTKDQLFLSALDRSFKNHTYDSAFDIHAPQWDRSALKYGEVQRYEELRKHALKLNLQASAIARAQFMQEFLRIVEGGTVAEIERYRQDDNLRFSLQGADWNRVLKALQTIPNPNAVAAICSVESLIVNDYSYWGEEDYKALSTFRNQVKELVNDKEKRIRKMYMRELETTLTEYLRDRARM